MLELQYVAPALVRAQVTHNPVNSWSPHEAVTFVWTDLVCDFIVMVNTAPADASVEGVSAGVTCAVQGLELAVPGTYIAGEPVVTIAAFAPQLHVITSKQRPRKLTIHGSDGAEYMFLLKASLSNSLLSDRGIPPAEMAQTICMHTGCRESQSWTRKRQVEGHVLEGYAKMLVNDAVPECSC